jgi:GNAT superfamily N-acetyltransferase
MKKLGLEIRRCEVEDIFDILNLFKIAALNLQTKGINYWNYWLDPPDHKLAWILDGLKAEEFNFVYHNNRLAAMYRLSTSDHLYWGEMNDTARYLHSFVVNPIYKGQGLGDLILDYIENDMIAQNVFILRLDCVAENSKLVSYYLSKGFKPLFEKQMNPYINQFFEKRLVKTSF